MGAEKTQDILLRIGITGDKSVDDLKKRNIELLKSVVDNQKEIDKLTKLNKELALAESDNSDAIAENIAKVKELKAVNQISNQELKQNINLITAEMGSLKEKRSQLSIMTAEYTKLSSEEAKNTTYGIDLGNSIKTLTDELKAEEKQIGQTYRNVGNYTDSIIDARAESDLTSKGIGELRRELNFLRNISLAGKTKEEIQEINQKIGDVTDALGDLKEVQKTLGTELGANIASSLQVITAGVESVAGSLALFGVGQENIAMVQKNLTALIAVSQALGVIEEALAKRTIQNTILRVKSSITNGVETASKWANTVATTAATKAETARAIITSEATLATKAAAVAQWIWNGAILANPIAAIIIAIAAFAVGIYALTKAFRSQNDEVMKTSVVFDDVRTAYANHIAKMKKMQLELALTQKQITQQQYDDEISKLNRADEIKTIIMEQSKKRMEAWYEWQKNQEEDNIEADRLYKETLLKIDQEQKSKLNLSQQEWLSQQQIDRQKNSEDEKKYDDDLQKKKAEASKKQIELQQKTQDVLTGLIKDSKEREEQQLFNTYDREYKAAEGNKKMQEALNQKYISDNEALQKKYSDESIKKLVETSTKEIELRLAAVKKGSEEELNIKLQLLEIQKNTELDFARSVKDGELLLNAKYRKLEDEAKEQHTKEVRNKLIADQAQEFQNKIAQMQLDGKSTLQVELENEIAKGAALQEKDFETNALFIAAKLDSANKIKDINAKIVENEIAAADAKIAIAQSFHSGLSSLMEIFGANEEENAGFAKALAVFQIGINTATGISAAVKAGAGLVFPANLGAILMGVTSVLAGIASAKKALSSAGSAPKAPKPKGFSTGGSVFGTGTGTSDSIPAYLSNGESVNTALSSAMFAPLLSALNQASGGAPIQSVNKSSEVYGEQFLANAFSKALLNMPTPVVSVEEITRVNNRVKVIESMARM